MWLFLAFILRGVAFGQVKSTIVPLTAASDSTTNLNGWNLVFSDEFDGTELDTVKWWPQNCTHQLELQYYTNRKKNVSVSDGLLHIKALKERYIDTLPYTSAILFSSREFDKGSLIKVRCKIPKGKGLWPAFWFWSGMNKVYQELDAFEFWCHDTYKYTVTNHWNMASGDPIHSESYTIKPRTKDGKRIDLSAQFMTYGVYWDEKQIIFLLNDQMVAKIVNHIPPKTFPIILNLAVDNDRKKKPNRKTIFPAEFLIDYVRVYQRQN